jgi:hypothetical protein
VIITITDKGSKVVLTGQPPYDSVEDTLVGVVNNSRLPITSIDLNSGLDIFGFEGDGIVSYGIPGNSRDPTGYGGPNAYFTNYSGGKGTVNFITPIPPGGSSYFSLEESINASVACTDLINKSVPKPSGGSPHVAATFTPQPVGGVQYTVAQAAALCGFVDFDWVQTIIREIDPNRLSALNLGVSPTTANVNGTVLPVHLGGKFRPAVPGAVKIHANMAAYSDPPQGGGYTYNSSSPDYSFPFYCDPTGDGICPRTSTTLSMGDTPTQTCMVDAAGKPGAAYLASRQIQRECAGTAKVGSSKQFVTHLAGVKFDGTAFDLGIGFIWTSNYNGTAGGVGVSGKNGALPDPGTGVGGATITSYSDSSNYQYSGIGVGGVNGQSQSQTLLDGSMVSTIASGLAFSRSSQTFNGAVTLTNISDSPISGPFQLVLTSLPAGVTLHGTTRSFGGFPYVTAPNVNSLSPGQSTTVILQFNNPSLATITFAPMVYSGSLE